MYDQQYQTNNFGYLNYGYNNTSYNTIPQGYHYENRSTSKYTQHNISASSSPSPTNVRETGSQHSMLDLFEYN